MITCCREPELRTVHHCGHDCPQINEETDEICERYCHKVCKNCDSGTCEDC